MDETDRSLDRSEGGDEMSAFADPLTQRIARFLDGIGIPVRAGRLEEPTFLPGIMIDGGRLLVDEERLLHPGDLLHEAGHIAVMSPETRGRIRGDLGQAPGDEMAAIAWSYAALLHLGLEPEVVFHPDGYHGESDAIIANFGQGRYFGVPMLQWYGIVDQDSYPAMQRWLR